MRNNSFLRLFLTFILLPVACGILSSLFVNYVFSKKREPQFIVSPVRSVVLKKSLVDNRLLIVSDKDGNEINRDISIVRFYLFNSGDIPIKQVDILDDLNLYFNDSSANILDYRILKSSRDLCKIELHGSDSIKEIGVSFKILEKGDGFSGQIIYSGLTSSELKLRGVIEGVDAIGSIEDARSGIAWRSILIVAVILIGILILIVVIFDNMKGKRTISERLTTRYSLWIKLEENGYMFQFFRYTYAKLLVISITCFILLFGLSSYVTIKFLINTKGSRIELPKVPESLTN